MRTPLLLATGLTTIAILSGAAAPSSAVTTRAEPVTLKYSWSPDRPLLYRLTQQTDADMSGVPGQGDVHLSQSQTMRLRLHVANVAPDGAATIRTTVEAVQFEMTPPAGEKVEYDSEAGQGLAPDPGEERHPAATAMAAFVGESFTFEIAPDGDVRNVQGMDAILRKISDQVGDPAMEEMFRGKFADSAMESMLEQAFKLLPDRPVEAGETWQTSLDQTVPSLGTLRIENTMTFERAEPADGGGQIARIPITISTTLDRTGVDDSELPEGTTISLEDSAGRGLLAFDIDRGELKLLEMTSRLPMRLTMTMGDEEVNIKQDVTSTVKFERLDQPSQPRPAPDAPPADD